MPRSRVAGLRGVAETGVETGADVGSTAIRGLGYAFRPIDGRCVADQRMPVSYSRTSPALDPPTTASATGSARPMIPSTGCGST